MGSVFLGTVLMSMYKRPSKTIADDDLPPITPGAWAAWARSAADDEIATPVGSGSSAKHRLPFLLLSDPDSAVCKTYGVYGKKSFMGREFLGIHRTTFVIDKQGTIRRVYPRVKVKEHAEDVLAFVRDGLS